jgi:hypothetical protein
LAASACGPIATEVGAELTPDSSAQPSATADSATADAPVCSGDLSNIGSGDFRVSFVITTTQTQFAALVNQRAVCAHAVFWDVRMTTGGLLAVETDDDTNYTPLTSSGAKVNDGRPHDVLVQRAAGTLTVYVDGVASGAAPSIASFGQLPPLRSGADACTAAIDGTMTFTGTLTDLCVSKA